MEFRHAKAAGPGRENMDGDERRASSTVAGGEGQLDLALYYPIVTLIPLEVW